MKELLTNEEIDTLMDMFRSEASELEQTGSQFSEMPAILEMHEAVVSPVDLLKPNRLSREQMHEFERMFESGAKAVGATMSDKLRYEMHCDCVAVEQTRFGSWMQLVGNNAAIYILKAAPMEIPVFFSVTTNLLYGSVDRILGGHGRVSDVPKEFTEAEFVVADAFLEPIFSRLAVAMEEMAEFEMSIEGRFTNPSLAHILPSQDVVLSVHLQTGGEFLLGDLRLALPYTAIEPYLAALGTGPGKFKQMPGSMRDVLTKTVNPVEVGMSVQLGEAELRLRDLLALGIGDVIPLDRRLGDPMVAPVAGVPKFLGQVGTIGSRLAYQIASVLE